jgi:hypothetical protein
LAYFEKSLIANGKVARYYEFRTNRPLYMNSRYELTYDDSAVPGHYGWTQNADFGTIRRAYEDARRGVSPPAAASAAKLEKRVRTIIRELDAGGRWVTIYAGDRLVGQPKFPISFHYISSDVFSRNIETLSDYLVPGRKK